MKDIRVVIGSRFGDEGKGLMTDYFASRTRNGIVVRFNGGAQAGHTVMTPEGKRHVFSHFGAGTFVGLPTFLSSFFVVNPMLFLKELAQLSNIRTFPNVFVDGDCYVTTLYDIVINQIAEFVRGEQRHGSCGVGFNETISRCLYSDEYSLSVKELSNSRLVREKLAKIQEEYLPLRLKQLSIEKIPPQFEPLLEMNCFADHFMTNVAMMLDNITITDITTLDRFPSIIFEGAQGLLLDQNNTKYFPNLTRSNTGMQNVTELISRAGYEDSELEVCYATRAYMTRHGAGAFPTELPRKPYERIFDLTNVPNEYQGTLRFGLMDIDDLAETIKNDLTHCRALKTDVRLAVTCLDQLDDKVDYFVDGGKEKTDVDEFLARMFYAVGTDRGYLSHGETRGTVTEWTLSE